MPRWPFVSIKSRNASWTTASFVVAPLARIACRTRRSSISILTRTLQLLVHPAAPETLSLGSWSWCWTGSVLATESSTVGGSEARLRFPVGTGRVRHVSDLMDSTNPDLSACCAPGGKLIVKEHIADYAQSPFAGIGYYQSVVARMGRAVADRFMRLYVTPGVNHGGSGVSGTTGEPIPQYVDLLTVLDRWAEQSESPGDLVQTSVELNPPSAGIASRPMCQFPKYPRYRGTGDPKAASSFTCEAQ
jgi:hypothetical protein